MSAKSRKRVGRPKLAASARKRNNLTFRARDVLRAALEKSASKNQRSVSEEIENQLEAYAVLRKALGLV